MNLLKITVFRYGRGDRRECADIWRIAGETRTIHLMFNIIDKIYEMFKNINIMGRKKTPVLPSVQHLLTRLGENIRLARLRRNLSVELVAERAGISRATLWAIEKGAPSVSMGSYAQVLLAIGLEKDLLLIAGDDELGRKLQDAGLPSRERASGRRGRV